MEEEVPAAALELSSLSLTSTSPEGPSSSAMEVPSNFKCPLTLDVMRDPVTNAVGQTYDRVNIQAWFALGHRDDPLTRVSLLNTTLTPNDTLRGAIKEFMEHNKVLAEKLAELEKLREKAEAQPTAEFQRFLDPITFRVMREPVRAEDGCVYDRASIERWMAECTTAGRALTSPTTGQPMGPAVMKEHDLEQEIKALWSVLSSKKPEEPDEPGDQQVASVHELCWIFSVLDHVEDVLKDSLGDWEPPRIVVLGAENSGKSTLLERLCLLPLFPHDKKICTRMAVRVSIRRFAAQLEPTLEVWDVTNKQRVGPLRTIPLASSESAIKEEMGRIIQEASAGSDVGVSVDRELRITLVSPHLPPMNLVDLPGLVENPPTTKEQTRRLAERYIADHTDGSLFLLVMSAETDPNQSPAISIVKEKGLEKRAVGVLTKCDRLHADEDDFDRVHELLMGVGIEDSIKLEPHGYVATSNKKGVAKGVEGTSNALLLQARHEVQFFRENGFGADIETGRATTQGLTNKITAMYTDYVRATWLPEALSRLRKEVRSCQEADVKLGLPAAPGNLNGEALKELQEAAVAAAQAAAASWLESFSCRLEKEVLRPLQAQLKALLTKARRGIPVGRESRALLDVQQEAAALCREAVAKLEALVDSNPEDPFENDPSAFRVQRFPGLMAKLRGALKGAVCHWENVDESVGGFLEKSLDPTTAPDLLLSYDMEKQPGSVDIVLPADRITSTVLFIVSRSVGRATQEAMEEMVGAICLEHLAAAGQEVEDCQGERQRLRRRHEDLEEAMHHLWQLKVGGGGPAQAPDAAVQEQVADYLAQEEEPVTEHVAQEQARPIEEAPQVTELNPAESARSYSSISGAGFYDQSCLDTPRFWMPGPGASTCPAGEWLQLDLGKVLPVRGVVTQGHGGWWVTHYEVHTSVDGGTFHRVAGGPFQGNVNGLDRATARFPAAVEARYIKIYPTSWHVWVALRCGVLVET